MTHPVILPASDALDTPRRAFFKALYAHAPDDLYLELRAIHPTSHAARSLWGTLGDKPSLASAFKQAEALNHEGYGVYFAPCLRQSRQGKAEAAAIVPALWVDIDCEGKPDQREAGLICLKDFDLAPSFIIDSGGGWYAYWLLDQPFVLQTEADRQKIAAILRGLFKVLGGDDAYVKTVAGIMRLPESVNTKQERGGALVRLMDSHPERRYSVEAFAWLESQSHPENKGTGRKVVQSERHLLPPRTEAYLSSGATEGHRNHKLFAAACQLRDAGHSQADVERDLISRYVADGCSEKEGLKTIQSVYSRPARDPLAQPQPRETARQQLDALEAPYTQPSHARKHPSPEQIEAVVQACAGLSPVQWAVERQRLKSLCGHGIKTADLDRMYRQTQREMPSRHSHQERIDDMEHYFESNGRMIYRYHTNRGPIDKVVADWTGRIRERVTCISDEGEQDHDLVLELCAGSHVRVITVPGEIFGDDLALRRFITGQAGEQFVCRAGMGRHLAVAILSLSGVYPTRLAMGFMGWTRLEDRWTYVAPDLTLTGSTLLDEAPQVDLESRLKDYRLRPASWDDSLRAFEAVMKVTHLNWLLRVLRLPCCPWFSAFFPPQRHVQPCIWWGQQAAANPRSRHCCAVSTVSSTGIHRPHSGAIPSTPLRHWAISLPMRSTGWMTTKPSMPMRRRSRASSRVIRAGWAAVA